MRLSQFIVQNMESILQAWEDFARTVDTPFPDLDAAGLRNHAESILRTVAMDMTAPQSVTLLKIFKRDGALIFETKEKAAVEASPLLSGQRPVFGPACRF